MNSARWTLLACLALIPLIAHGQSDADRKAEAKVLSARATAVTKKIGELASSGKLPTDDEGIALLKRLVDELSEIRQRLTALEGDMIVVKSAPPKTTVGGYTQFQYRSTDQLGGQPDAFQIRRARLNIAHQIDPKALVKLSVDFAAGTNQLSAQLKDALLQYDFGGGFQGTAGQFTLPLSYQLTTSDTDRQFPERTMSVGAIFNGERSRGVMAKAVTADGLSGFVGIVDSLTISDAEGANSAPGGGSHLAGMGGVGYSKNGVQGSISYFAGRRPPSLNGSTAAPDIDRSWLIVDGGYDSPNTPFSLRAEFLTGKDRVPGTANPTLALGTDQRAWSVQAGARLTAVDGLYARYESWDRDTGNSGFRLNGFGLSYLRDLTASIRFVGAWERYTDDQLARSFSITTLRLQMKF